ncbi:ABC transporter permease, partial [Yoonia sp.]|uniref:ABC transporter permease n=1 Tax=Yoonia sp. TaxID=2212373 RepID=UPI002DF884BB|nr:ABC transporter permease [Yoonia sp.]
MRRFLSGVVRTPRGGLSAAVLMLVVVCALFAPMLSPYDYAIQNLPEANSPPSAAHWMGTDEFGRDLMSRIIQGARTSLSVAMTAISISVVVGMTLGATAG